MDPQEVVNRYTGEHLIVGCGVCKACLLQKARSNELKCEIENLAHKYSVFVTLTYAPQWIPQVKPVSIPGGYVLVGQNPRLNRHYESLGLDFNIANNGYILGFLHYSDAKYSLTHALYQVGEKTGLHGNISYASVYDCQNFIKRLRSRLSYNGYEKVRYYAVSEYGPKTFRAHFHLLFYCDSFDTVKYIQENISKMWKYGRCTSSVTRSSAISYTSGYVNSFGSLPRFYRKSPFRPFSLHSTRFGHKFFESSIEEDEKDDFDRFISRSVKLGDTVVSIRPFRTYISAEFPKCRDFANLNIRETYSSYTLYPKCVEIYGKDKTVVDYAYDIIHRDGMNPSVRRYFANKDWLHEEFVPRIASELYLSKLFCRSCKFDSFKYWWKNDAIHRFYYKMDMMKLAEFYQMQEEYIKEYAYCDRESFGLAYFYDNYDDYVISEQWPFLVEPLKKSRVYQDFVQRTESDFDKSIKHKVLNDLNKFFTNL